MGEYAKRSEYISREAAKDFLCDFCIANELCTRNGDCFVMTKFKAIPAADVVEVVRCADCKYDERCMVQDFVRDNRVVPYDKTVFFCADGKHKDGGQDE